MHAGRVIPAASASGKPSLPWRSTDTGIVIRFRLTPRSSRSAIDGRGETAEGPAILARVNAVPEDNAANMALTELVAAWLQCPKRDVALIGGAKSRIKNISVVGDPEGLARRLSERLAVLGSDDRDPGQRAR